MHEDRFYRKHLQQRGLSSYQVRVEETDLLVSTDTDIYDIALDSVIKYRFIINNYIQHHPDFLSAMGPYRPDLYAPEIIKDMILFSSRCGVGPMASVAGALAHFVGSALRRYSKNVLIENGGDDYLYLHDDATVSIFAGNSPLSNKIYLKIRKIQMPIGVCTSSGTVGHSLSFGKADAVCVLSRSATLADAAATAIGNRVVDKKSIHPALEWGMGLEDVTGVIIIMGDRFGVLGDVEIA